MQWIIFDNDALENMLAICQVFNSVIADSQIQPIPAWSFFLSHSLEGHFNPQLRRQSLSRRPGSSGALYPETSFFYPATN